MSPLPSLPLPSPLRGLKRGAAAVLPITLFASAFLIGPVLGSAAPASATEFKQSVTMETAMSQSATHTAVRDSAYITGANGLAPTGTVDFALYGANDPTCQAPIAVDTVTLLPISGQSASYIDGPFHPIGGPGTYRAIATYSGDATYQAQTGLCNDPGESVTIGKGVPTLTSQMSPSVKIGGILQDTAYLSGGFAPTGEMAFAFYGPNDATCSLPPVLTMTTNVLAGGTTSYGLQPTSRGTYRAIASYLGDAANHAVSGLCNDANESANVTLYEPTITSQMSASVVLGGKVSDTAYLHDGSSPTGTINFSFYGPDDIDCSGDVVFSYISIVDGQGSAQSATFEPGKAGVYRSIATYNGDSKNNYASAQGMCNDPGESVLVTRAPTTIVTELSLGQIVGIPIADYAIVESATDVTGTITFQIFGPNDATCSTTPVSVSTKTVALPAFDPSNSIEPIISDAYIPVLPGAYRAVAHYSGDANNLPADGVCGEFHETTFVDPARPLFSTEMKATADGSGIIDTLQFGEGFAMTGTITFSIYGPDDATCSSTPVFISTVPVTGFAVYASAPYQPTVSGTYRTIAAYSGDAANLPIAAKCNDKGESIAVSVPQVSILSTLPTTPTPTALASTGPSTSPLRSVLLGGLTVGLGAVLMGIGAIRRRTDSI